MNRFWSKVDIRGPDECWPWKAGKTSDGRGTFWLDGRNIGAHVAAYILKHGPVPEGQIVRHSCDNGPCCNPRHLLPGTQADNMADKVERNRQAKGEDNGNSRLSESIVRAIRARHTKHCKRNGTKALSAEFGVTRKIIVDIVNCRIWRHVA